jgi:hypothetical protein
MFPEPSNTSWEGALTCLKKEMEDGVHPHRWFTAGEKNEGTTMPVLYIDDGSPDSREYDNNYLYYDEDDPERMQAIVDLLDRRAAAGRGAMTAERRALLNAIERCRRSAAARGNAGADGEGAGRSPGSLLKKGACSLLQVFAERARPGARRRLAGDLC